jgi:hypothetical protein
MRALDPRRSSDAAPGISSGDIEGRMEGVREELGCPPFSLDISAMLASTTVILWCHGGGYRTDCNSGSYPDLFTW